ncbi:unnamed protein product [Paramecium pentaurelia]|uniref:Uncharacterized protein n=1 Tax=Paramecium pentaurelia TaxID=43138 RepID=A0A8S1XH38_9CILI|nr:unnamed protein product [Paramecium pentaurelia]
MLFRQKEKVPDRGKDNFRDFMRREGESCQQTQMRLSTFIHKTVPNDQTKSQLSSAPYVLDGSLKMFGNTWDAKHLGTFLQKSQFASIDGNPLKNTEPYQNSMKNQSFFFRSQQTRNTDDHVINLHQHTINHLISDHPTIKNGTEFLEKKLLSVPDKTFDESKLNYITGTKLKKPKEQFQEMVIAKENRLKFQQWRSEYQDVNRAFKKAKQCFKSGLYALDNPLNDNTKLYKEENAKLRGKEQKSVRNNLQRYKSLEKFNASNPAIEFQNIAHKPFSSIQQDPLLTKSSFPSQNFELHDQWKKRKMIEQNVDTKSRIFGENSQNKVNSQRTVFLREQELRGRNYNPVNLTKSLIGC